MDDHNINDLWKCFFEVGKVGEVIVPTKLDRFGKRFGFVRLEERLKDFWIGSYKLFINKPRFDRVKQAHNMNHFKKDYYFDGDNTTQRAPHVNGSRLQGAWRKPLLPNERGEVVGKGSTEEIVEIMCQKY
ncbi:hypothetical protein RIF29_21028 [Crotalaria pallida]|uniref:Nucleotide-binding alpha-beta plait domain-containing protein n=1 Tax=Crotalaria pallida TaxID=3830 RepID=A0AAN9I955_CROPI